MLRAAYIQVQQAGRPDREAVALLEELPRRGIEATTFTLKQLSRRRLGLAPDVLVAGGMEAVRGALKQLGRTGTELPTYPLSLRDRLGRTVWEATLGAWRIAYDEWEFCHILSGRSIIEDENGDKHELVAGDRFIIRPGFRGIWRVIETTRKDYVIRL